MRIQPLTGIDTVWRLPGQPAAKVIARFKDRHQNLK